MDAKLQEQGSPGEQRAWTAGNGGSRQRTLARSKALKSTGPGSTRNATRNGMRATASRDAGTAERVGKALEGMASEGMPVENAPCTVRHTVETR